jgi:hypothetical protein
MKIIWLGMFFLTIGCASSGEANLLLVAPTQNDWEVAFSRLSSTEQILIKKTPMTFGISQPPVDQAIYHMTGTSLTKEIIGHERLDIVTICNGFNRTFNNGSGKSWTITEALSYEQIGTPSGVQTHRFELRWAFVDSKGKALAASAMDFGPGVKIIWGASREAVAAETNQAFALTFLRLVAQLIERDEQQQHVRS